MDRQTRAQAVFSALILLLFFFCFAGVFAQNEPSGGDEPLRTGAAAILGEEAPPSRGTPETRRTYLRTAILPMSSPGAPLRIRFEKPVNLETLRRFPSRLDYSIGRRYGSHVQGKWEWKDSRELRFIPAAGAVDLGDEVYVSLSGEVPLAEDGNWVPVSAELELYVEHFQMGNKTGSEPVVPGSPRFVAFLNSGSKRIGNGPLYLLYDQPVGRAALGLVSAVAGNRPLEMRAVIPSSIYFDPEGRYDTSHVIALSFPELPPDQGTVKIRYPLIAVTGTESFAENTLTVFTNFSWSSRDLQRLKEGIAARLSSEWDLHFNSPVDSESFRAAFSISPQPPSLRLYFYGSSSSSSTVAIHAEFDIGKVYSMKLDENFTDVLGNRLGESLLFAFRSQDLEPVFTLPAEALTLETGTNRLPARYRNLREITINVLKYPNPGAYIESLASGPSGEGSRPETGTITVRPNPNGINNLYNADFGIDTGPGLKLLDITAYARGSEAGRPFNKQMLVQTTNLGISAKVSDGAVFCWVTALNNAMPVAGAKLSLYDARGTVIAGGVNTGANGTALIKTSAAKAAQLDRTIYVAAEYSGDAAICVLANNQMSSPWQFNLPGAVNGVNPLAAALFTERGVYRPGEAVYFKTFVRDLAEYGGVNSVQLVVKDSRGREVYRNSKNLDAYRGVAWELKLGNDAAVGEYTAALSLGSFSTRAAFQVEEYRAPTFQVDVSSPDPEWKIETAAAVECSAEYLRGGVLGGKQFSWLVYRQPEIFAPAAFPGYVFTMERDPNTAGTVHDERGRLDSGGRARLAFRPSFPDSWGPMRYIVQAAVTDDDRQNYAGRISRIVHGSELYAGMRPPDKKIFRSGETIRFPFIVTDTSGAVRSGENVTLYIDTLSYDQNTMLDDEGNTSTYNREAINTGRVTSSSSAAAPKELSWTPPRAGYYRLRLVVEDRNGRSSQTGFAFAVSGGGSVAWPRYDRERIDLVLDKQSYKIGDIAAAVIQTPFENARGLLTIEANGVLDAYPFSIDKNTPRVTFPVRSAYLPNAYVSVILLRGRAHYAKDATGFETGAPAYRIGYTRLEVDPEAQRLTLTLPSVPLTASPGQKVDIGFSVRTAEGRPSDASAAVMVVDEAVLGLTGYTTPDPIRLAYSFRILSVRNASNLLDLPHSRRSRYEALFPSGDSDEAALLPRSDDILRRLFKSTAYFAPAVPVGADGRGSVSFTLPDNLTTYRIMIVAANKQGMMGQAAGALLTRRSLAVEPVLPRFVYEEDRFVLQARVFNGTGAALETSVSAVFRGIEAGGGAARTVRVPAGDSILLSWDAKVAPNAEEVRLIFNASAGNLKDAVENAIPVRRRGNLQRTVTSTLVNSGGAVNISLPPERSGGTLDISISDTPLSELKDAVEYLLEYPHGCIEQTTSGTYPLIVLADLLPSIGVSLPPQEIRKFASAGVERLMKFRTPSGGLAYWPGEGNPHAFGTAFGLAALIEAQKRGYAIPEGALDEMAKYLEGIIAKNTFTNKMNSGGDADADTLAFFAMTLGRMGRPQIKLMGDLWKNKNALSPFGLSLLAAAHKEAGSRAPEREVPLRDVLNAIRKEASERADSATFEGSSSGSWSFDSPTRKNAVALMAYAIAAPDDPMTVKFLRGLLDKRQHGFWGTTQGNVFGIMAVYHLVSGSAGTGGTAREVSVTVDGKRYAGSQLTKLSDRSYSLKVGEADLPASNRRTIQVESNRPGSLYVNVRGIYRMPLNAAFLAPRSRGITYRRTFETLEGRPLGNEIPLGSLVRVRLAIGNNGVRNYVAIEDLLPACFEALNTSLLATEAVDQSAESELARRSRQVISYRDFGDHRAAFYADELKGGDYEFVYYARVTTAGTFFLPISLAEAMYDPDAFGTTGGGSLTVR